MADLRTAWLGGMHSCTAGLASCILYSMAVQWVGIQGDGQEGGAVGISQLLELPFSL